MKVRDLIAMDVDLDVYEDVTDDFCIGFVGPLELTEEGEREFHDVLSFDVEIDEDALSATVSIDYPIDEVWEKRLFQFQKFFNSAAGYCSDSNYKKWFKETVK